VFVLINFQESHISSINCVLNLEQGSASPIFVVLVMKCSYFGHKNIAAKIKVMKSRRDKLLCFMMEGHI